MVRLIFGFILLLTIAPLLRSGLMPISAAFASTQDMIDYYCGGKTPCYLCTDGSQIQKCINDKLCPIKKTSCYFSYSTLFTLERYYTPCSNCCNGCYCTPSKIGGFAFNHGYPLTGGKYYLTVIKTFSAPETTRYLINFTLQVFVRSSSCKNTSIPYYAFTLEAFINNRWLIISYSGSSNAIENFSNLYKPQLIYKGTPMRITLRAYSPSFSSWISVTGKLEVRKGIPKCPYSNKPCYLYSGNYYCSPYPCYNVVTTPTQITDTPEGINDKENDAPVTDQGCLGNIYIFNGHDMRCRPPGIQTGFSDCCVKTSTWFGLGQCTQTEKELATLRNWGKLDGSCHYVGEYCTEKWLGVCVQKKKTYCCYSSPLARIIVEAAHKQLSIPWGTPESPNCRGLTPEEFQKVDFSKVDFSEWINYEVKTNIIPTVNTSLSNAINSLQTSVQSSY